MKKIVVFFPSWRYFGHFALPLFEQFSNEFEVVFFHTEQAVYGWDDCPDLSNKGIETVDLQTLGTFSFIKALEKLQPDCVVVFDKGWVQDRALLHAARHMKVPSIQVQHGSVAMLDNVETHHKLKRACSEFMKIVRTFRLYNKTMADIGLLTWVRSLPRQMQLILNPNKYYYAHRDEVAADCACIIGASERAFFLTKEGYEDAQLIAMGSSEFEAAYARKKEIMHIPAAHNRILLISQPLFEDHYFPGSMDAKKKFIRNIIDAVSALDGISIAIKPHPRESHQWYQEHFEQHDLYVYPQGSNLNETILENRYVIGFFSTALINALILGRPVGIIRWMGDHGFAPNFDEDGAAMSLRSSDDLVSFVMDYKSNFDVSWYAYDTCVYDVLRECIGKLTLQ